MMELNTRDFGVVSVQEDAVFNFPDGVYGFEDCKQFAVFEKKFDDISFLYLQDVENTTPCFLIFEPWDLYPGYTPQISKEDMKACEINDIEELIFLTIANIPTGSFEELFINIKSPIVLNPKTHTGRQIILQNPDYKVRFQPFLGIKEAMEEGKQECL